MLRLLRLIELTTAGTSLMRGLLMQYCLADMRAALALLILCHAMAVLLIGGAFGLLYLGLVHFAALPPQSALLVTGGGLVAVAALVFALAAARLRRLTRMSDALLVEKKMFAQVGHIASAFMDGFREGKSGD